MKRMKTALYMLMVCALLVGTAFAAEDDITSSAANKKGMVYSTWEGFEGDKCASIWLIKRFIDSDAVIKFFPKGEVIEEGVPFDTPDAKFRRYHNMSTYESLLKHYKLRDPRLVFIGNIIHDMEVNIWEKKRYSETRPVMDAINHIIRHSKGPDEIIKKGNHFFDGFYRRVSMGKGQ